MEGLLIFLLLGIIVGVSAGYNLLRKRMELANLNRKLEMLHKNNNAYHVLKNVKLTNQEITIHSLVFSVYGIFVIQPEHRMGVIEGDVGAEQWLVKRNKQQNKFPNPLIKAKKKARALAEVISLNEKHVHEIVTFTKAATLSLEKEQFKNEHVVHEEQIIDTIQAWKTPQLSKQTVANMLEKLQTNSK
ncbi:nuclease-related domain-containing protein [Paraliobacillus ryukyuensis]|uniref:nuclease-related domain-containing protein n=1 Tax=Paraliobacillus ryukyuensis TaxID=200904 RepID=UPI0015C4419D|nr:nuclease-related domain-containing protein [Paraliobacillus ryukyuensis]